MKTSQIRRLLAVLPLFGILLFSNLSVRAADNNRQAELSGTVYGDGRPLAGVRVSDGISFSTTDERGCYRFASDKSGGFIFVVTPANYVPAQADGIQPLFWAALDTDAPDKDERHDFHLTYADHTRYTILFVTDLHLTGSSEKHDLDHYRRLTLPVLKEEAEKASADGPVYTFNLGDLSHELFWYQYDFDLASAKQFLEENEFPTRIYSIPGNHDNDGGIHASPQIDREAEWLYRKLFGPTYYSMDIGNVHWIMMDNILYKNTAGKGKKNRGIAGARDYDKGFTTEQLRWLRRDLETVDPSRTVCLCTHCPILFDRDRETLLTDARQLDSLDACFAKFDKVRLFAGHAHRTLFATNAAYPRFEQYVLPATSGDMWVVHDHFQALCPDGSDAGIVVATIDGDSLTRRYRTQAYGDKVLRAYDMNSVGEFYRTNKWVALQRELYPDRADYARPEFENCVYVNYWDFQPGRRVEMYENGVQLTVKQVEDEDPLYNLSCYLPELSANPRYKKSRARVISHHMFAAKARSATSPVEIRILDADNRVIHRQILIRPKVFDKDAR